MEIIGSSTDSIQQTTVEERGSDLEEFVKAFEGNLRKEKPELADQLAAIPHKQLKEPKGKQLLVDIFRQLNPHNLENFLPPPPSQEMEQFFGPLIQAGAMIQQMDGVKDPNRFFSQVFGNRISREVIPIILEACSYLEGKDLIYMKRALNVLVANGGGKLLQKHPKNLTPQQRKGLELVMFQHDGAWKYHSNFMMLQSVLKTALFEFKAAQVPPSSTGSMYLAPRVTTPRQRPDVGSYEELVSRIPKKEMALIEARMNELSDVDTNLEEIETCLKEGRYKDLHRDAYFYALRGLKEGRFSSKYVVRISDIETLRKQGKEFDVVDFVAMTQNEEELKEILHKATGKHLNKDQLEEFARVIKDLPPEDRWIMLFSPNRQKVPKEFLQSGMGETFTISQEIEGRVKMNVFNRLKVKPDHYARMSASLELYSAFLQVRFGEDAVTPNPVFGISTIEQIENNGFTNTRDVCCFHLVPTPDGLSRLATFNEADGFPCEENDFNFHDRYHVFVTSSMGREARAEISKIAEELKDFILEKKDSILPSDYYALVNLWWTFVDMDQPSRFQATWYHHNGKENLNDFADYKDFQENPKLHMITELFVQYGIQFARKMHTPVVNTPENRVIRSTKLLEETFVHIASSLPSSEAYQSARQKFGETFAKKASHLFGLSSHYETLNSSPVALALKA